MLVGRRFQPVKSGNPGGRPRIISNIRDLACEHTAEAVDALVRNLRCGNPHAEIAAASALLDRGFGKPLQKAEAPLSALDSLSSEARAAIDVICAVMPSREYAIASPRCKANARAKRSALSDKCPSASQSGGTQRLGFCGSKATDMAVKKRCVGL